MKCYRSLGDGFASFQAPNAGKVKSIKLSHVSGVSCAKFRPSTRWGCAFFKINQFQTTITDSTNKAIFPSERTATFNYIVDGGNKITTKEVILTSDVPYSVKEGDELRIWYGEDLLAHLDPVAYSARSADNDGDISHCVKILKYC